jgi:hypothetical protein
MNYNYSGNTEANKIYAREAKRRLNLFLKKNGRTILENNGKNVNGYIQKLSAILTPPPPPPRANTRANSLFAEARLPPAPPKRFMPKLKKKVRFTWW